jgi:hypothetical protein
MHFTIFLALHRIKKEQKERIEERRLQSLDVLVPRCS